MLHVLRVCQLDVEAGHGDLDLGQADSELPGAGRKLRIAIGEPGWL